MIIPSGSELNPEGIIMLFSLLMAVVTEKTT
jgi:hypothetical protein